MDEPWGRGEHLLLWAHTGQGHVSLATGETYRLSAGEGIWIPSTTGRSVRTDPGSLVIPTWIAPGNVPRAPEHPATFTVQDSWRDWLIQHYAHMVAPITSFGYAQAGLLDIFGGRRPPATARCLDDVDSSLPIPRSPTAEKVARELLRNPALDYTVEEWAALVACSSRTLRRDFANDTGWTFSRWRTRCRLAAALEFLAEGYSVSLVAARVGFASRNGFTRSFHNEYGSTPTEFVQRSVGPTSGVTPRVTVARQGDALANLLDGPAQARMTSAAAPALPATRTAPRVNDFHVLIWTYKGTGHAVVGETTYPRARGDVIWLPAGVENQTGSPANSLGLPLGSLTPGEARFDEPLSAHFSPSWDTYLLHCSVSAYTKLRPGDYDPRRILHIFDEQLAVHRARTLPMPADARARAAAIEFLRRIGSPSRGAAADLGADIDHRFRRETGLSFTSWQHAARMSVARDLLSNGAKPTSVAGRVGYTQVSNFSRAFTRFHGMSPRTYRLREMTDGSSG